MGLFNFIFFVFPFCRKKSKYPWCFRKKVKGKVIGHVTIPLTWDITREMEFHFAVTIQHIKWVSINWLSLYLTLISQFISQFISQIIQFFAQPKHTLLRCEQKKAFVEQG